MKLKRNQGFSLIEIMIVLVVLPVIAIVSTQALINVLSGQRKVESEVHVRQSIEQIFSYMERNIFNAQDVTCPTSRTIEFEKDVDSFGQFTCNPNASSGGIILYYADITGSSVQLNEDDVNIKNCVFVCSPAGVGGAQPGVRVTIGVNLVGQEDIESGSLELTRRFHTRSY